jgi:hypothetical protein
MSARDDGGPAFPQTRQQWQDSISGGRFVQTDTLGGMTLRDWFAGQPDIVGSALLIAKEQGEALAGPRPDDPLGSYKWQCQVLAALRYIAADAMIAERAKEGGE